MPRKKPTLLKLGDLIIRFTDFDMSTAMLNTLIAIVCDRIAGACSSSYPAPMPPTPASLTEAMPGHGWYAICSNDVYISVTVAEYDPGTYARFVIEWSRPIAFIVYKLDRNDPPIMASALAGVEIEDALCLSSVPALMPPRPDSTLDHDDDAHLARKSTDMWSEQELTNLHLGVQKYGRRWKTIAATFHFPGRSWKSLSLKWDRITKGIDGDDARAAAGTGGGAAVDRRKCMPPFTPEETTMLVDAVVKHGQNWTKIAQIYDFGGRDRRALRKKWTQLQGMEHAHDRMDKLADCMLIASAYCDPGRRQDHSSHSM